MRFFGLKSVILLSKMGKRALDSLKFTLIWELPMAIYEDIIKVDCSRKELYAIKKEKKKKKLLLRD